MNKQEFIKLLREKLSNYPQKDVEDRITFYSEMIDDKIEDGILEEDAIKEIGDIDIIISQIKDDIFLSNNTKVKSNKKRKLNAWEIVLIVIGSPIWLTILLSILAVVFSAYVSLWAGIITLWAVLIATCVFAIYGIIIGGIMMIIGDTIINLVLFSMGLVCAGLIVFIFYGCLYSTKGLIILTKKIIFIIKNLFKKGGNVNE
ncbi:MAG: DUF1700 domain-containing protein [Clostridia bacterium]|nr:DUF1700 domain-containing protein [Clostridia bacterium]